MTARPQSPGRSRNAAEPLGEKKGVSSREDVERTGRASRRAAGPDGPDAAEVAEATTGRDRPTPADS